MDKLSEADANRLKRVGFKSYEISHIKAGRTDRISKKRLQQFKKIIKPKIKRTYNKPIIIEEKMIKLKPFIKLKPIRR